MYKDICFRGQEAKGFMFMLQISCKIPPMSDKYKYLGNLHLPLLSEAKSSRESELFYHYPFGSWFLKTNLQKRKLNLYTSPWKVSQAQDVM